MHPHHHTTSVGMVGCPDQPWCQVPPSILSRLTAEKLLRPEEFPGPGQAKPLPVTGGWCQTKQQATGNTMQLVALLYITIQLHT